MVQTIKSPCKPFNGIPGSSSTAFVGSWYRVRPERYFENDTQVDIIDGEDGYSLRLNDRRYKTAPVTPITFTSDASFHCSYAHWIMRGQVQMKGQLDDEGLLILQLHGEGMTGLEDDKLFLEKGEVGCKLYGQATKDEAEESTPQEEMFPSLVPRILKDYSGSSSEPLSPRIDAVMISRNDQVMFERYFGGMGPSTLHMISSCTKSITSILAGIAIDLGLFHLDDSILSYFPLVSETGRSPWSQTPPILVSHVLSMTTGTKHDIEDSQALLACTDIENLVLNSPVEVPPGTRYHYDNGLPSLIGRLIEVTSGMSLEDFAAKYLFEPLGIKDYRWTRMRSRSDQQTKTQVLASGGLSITLPSLAKIFRHVFLPLTVPESLRPRLGLLSQSYIDQATKRQTPESDYPYGFYFHLNEVLLENGKGTHLDHIPGFLAIGQGEQYVFVSPETGVMIIVFSSTWNRASDRDCMGLLNELVMKKLRDSIDERSIEDHSDDNHR